MKWLCLGYQFVSETTMQHKSLMPCTARTYPTFPSGRFTPPQAELYTAILDTLKHCTSLCTESNRFNLYDLHTESCRVLTKELNRIGFNLRERSASAGNNEVEQVLYPHFLSHSVGIGVSRCLKAHGSTCSTDCTDLHESFLDRSSPYVSI